MYNFSTFSYKLFLHKCSDMVCNILLYVVIEQTVVVTMIALWTEQGCSITRNGIKLGIDRGDNNGTANSVHTGIGNTRGDKFTFNGK